MDEEFERKWLIVTSGLRTSGKYIETSIFWLTNRGLTETKPTKQRWDHMQFGPKISNLGPDLTSESFCMLHLFVVRRRLKTSVKQEQKKEHSLLLELSASLQQKMCGAIQLWSNLHSHFGTDLLALGRM